MVSTGSQIAVQLVMAFILLAVTLLLAFLYLRSLQNVLLEVDPKNREVEPNQVWLMLIPLFNLVYAFILYPKVCSSIEEEFIKRKQKQSGDYGRGLALVMPILNIASIIPMIGGLAGLACIIIWIIFWVKIIDLKNLLQTLPKEPGMAISNSPDLLD